MATPGDITLVRGGIHNPDEPRHFMRVVPASGRRVAHVGDTVVADSDDAVVVKEVGRDIYDPIVYFPRGDVVSDVLVQIDKTTHCPLKGDTDYFDLAVDGQRIAEAAWSYHNWTVTDDLVGLVAFDPGTVTVTVE